MTRLSPFRGERPCRVRRPSSYVGDPAGASCRPKLVEPRLYLLNRMIMDVSRDTRARALGRSFAQRFT